jgi:hypothetical protein
MSEMEMEERVYRRVSLAGQRFGKLVVIGWGKREANGGYLQECLCDCGRVCSVKTKRLKEGKRMDCPQCSANRRDVGNGRVRRKTGEPKGYNLRSVGPSIRGHELYPVWSAIQQRCYNPKNPQYKDYGGRGITMSKEWRNSFVQFLQDMGPRPEKHEINRIDNNKGYCASNCEWTTRAKNMLNRRGSRWITWQGQTKTLTEWSHELGLNYARTNQWLRKGLNLQECIDKETTWKLI